MCSALTKPQIAFSLSIVASLCDEAIVLGVSHEQVFSVWGQNQYFIGKWQTGSSWVVVQIGVVLLFHFIEVNWMALYSSTFGKFRKDVFHCSAL